MIKISPENIQSLKGFSESQALLILFIFGFFIGLLAILVHRIVGSNGLIFVVAMFIFFFIVAYVNKKDAGIFVYFIGVVVGIILTETVI